MLGVTVCVNYSGLLRHTLPSWIAGLGVTECLVVTDLHDRKTVEVAEQNGAELHRTDRFYQAGAAFNKGGALAEAFASYSILERHEWICLFDADIMPPPLWHWGLETLEPGCLYSASRWQADALSDVPRHDLKQIQEGPDGLCGYFLLFHSSDLHVPQPPEPVFTSWQHAGNYDTVFTTRWPTERYRYLPLRMIHIGTERNWWGVDWPDAMEAMYRERRRRGGTYDHEAVGAPTGSCPRCCSEWKQDARNVRMAWMEMTGLSDKEIEEQCAHCPPTDLDEEIVQYNAMRAIQAMNG